MDTLSRDSLSELTAGRAEHTVSIFLSTHRVGPDSRPFASDDVIRWKNLLRRADRRLTEAGVPARDVGALLAPARALTDDGEFWQYQADGLAVFAAPDLCRTFRVPLAFDDLVVVAPGFHVTPLLPLLVEDARFHVLALSQNAVRLIEATRTSASEVDLATAPSSLRQALRFDDPERQLQYHTATNHAGGRRAAVFHGHGVGTDDREDNVLRFCQQVDRGLAPVLRASAGPLVLAAVDSTAAIYRRANTYRHLLETGVTGNPEALSAMELQARAWPLVEAELRATRGAAAERYRNDRGSARATASLVEALRAAADGRIDVLFVPAGVQRWGTFVESTHDVVLHGAAEVGDQDLLNVLAIRTWRRGGTVYVVAQADMPDGGDVAALLRY